MESNNGNGGYKSGQIGRWRENLLGNIGQVNLNGERWEINAGTN